MNLLASLYKNSHPIALGRKAIAAARATIAAFRGTGTGCRLLTAEHGNAKILAGSGRGVMGLVLHLAPASLSGFNVCSHASAGCANACLNHSGRNQAGTMDRARVSRTLALLEHPGAFLTVLAAEISAAAARATRDGKLLAVRLNGTSDLLWERISPELFRLFPTVQFYDYTKIPGRFSDAYRARWSFPENYDLTFSRSEENGPIVESLLAAGAARVAVAFDTPKGEALPATYLGRPVIDADAHDWRFSDPVGVVAGLRAKGPKGKADDSGFVVRVA